METRSFWSEELSDERRDELIAKAAKEVTSRRLEVPAMLALELQKPVANISMHAALGLGGFIAPIIGFNRFDDLTRLLAERQNIERLVLAIEEAAEQRDNDAQAAKEATE
jgi:hypothetical protein